MDWDTYFMSMCDLVAMKSKDPMTNYGAVIVGLDHEVLSTGYNSLPRGFPYDDDPKYKERPEKYFWFEHAERNAIYNAARNGTQLYGTTIYINGIPCIDCARAIVQTGIMEVVMDMRNIDITSPVWRVHHTKSIQLFEACGIRFRYHNESINKISIKMNGIDRRTNDKE